MRKVSIPTSVFDRLCRMDEKCLLRERIFVVIIIQGDTSVR